MQIALFSFKDKDVSKGLKELIDSYLGDELTLLMPLIKPIPKFFESVIKLAKETPNVTLKCFFVSAEGYDQYLKYAEDLVVCENPVKEILRALTPDDELAMVWDDTPQSHFIIHAVEDLAIDMWDISDELTTLDEEDFGFEMDEEELHDEMISTMGKFVDLLAAFVANTVMESLGQAVAQHLMESEEDMDKRDFNPFDDMKQAAPVRVPSKAFYADLTDYQFRLFITICRLAGFKRSVKAPADELAILTGNVNVKTVRRGLKALEDQGLIWRTPTKRNGGLRSTDVIHIGDSNVHTVGDANVHTTHDKVTNSYLSHPANRPLVPNSHISQDSYKLKDLEETSFLKEVKVPMKKYDDGDDLTGFGLVEPKDAPQPKIRKNDPKTRGRRPEHEWTPMDVAAEFSYQVGRKYPLLPGTVSVKQLSGALSKFRKQYGTTALIELELLRLFMANEDNFKEIGDEAPFLYKRYLSSFGSKMNQARENLGLGKIHAKISTKPVSGTLTASDGTVFQNSLSGRAQLERYEKRLKEKNNG